MNHNQNFVLFEVFLWLGIPALIVLFGFTLSEEPSVAYSIWFLIGAAARGFIAFLWDIYAAFIRNW